MEPRFSGSLSSANSTIPHFMQESQSGLPPKNQTPKKERDAGRLLWRATTGDKNGELGRVKSESGKAIHIWNIVPLSTFCGAIQNVIPETGYSSTHPHSQWSKVPPLTVPSLFQLYTSVRKWQVFHSAAGKKPHKRQELYLQAGTLR